MQKIAVEPSLDGGDASHVSLSPQDVSAYDAETETVYLYDRYQLATEDINTWHEIRETMVRTQY